MTRGAAKHATNQAIRALIMVVIGAGVMVSPTRAAADERPVLVLDATGTDEGRTMVARIEKHMGPDPALGPVPDRFRLPLREPTATDTSWKAEESVAAEARKLLTPIGYRQAAEIARAAQDRLARFAGDPAARALLSELVLIEGLAVAGASGLDAARPLFLLVHRLTPGRTLDPGRYLPDVVKAFNAAAVTGATGRISIKAVGATEVLVDGVPVPGGEPVVGLPVPAGPHIVTVRGDEISSDGRRVEAVASNTVPFQLTPVEAPLAVRLGRARDRLVAAGDDPARVLAIRDLLGAMKPTSHALVVVRGDDGRLAARVFTDRGGLGPSRPIGGDVAAAVAPLRPIKTGPIGGGNGNDPFGGGGKPVVPIDEPWWRTSWFKASGGTVAGVAAVVLITVIVTRDAGTSTFSPGVEVEQ